MEDVKNIFIKRKNYNFNNSTLKNNLKFNNKNNLSIYLCLFIVIIVNQIDLTNGLPTHKNNNEGCFHNGTRFAEESIVPTIEPCLTCRCINRTLICALRICPEQPIPPPRGCIVVHRNGLCCPHLSCTKVHVLPYGSQDRRVAAYGYNHHHYDPAEQDRIEYGNNHLRRSDDEETIDESGVCIFNGTVYRPGSAMTSSTLCSYCYCIAGRQKCVKPKCLLAPNGCRPVFVKSMCCPIRYDCSGKAETVKPTIPSSNQVKQIIKNRFTKYPTRSPRGRGCFINSQLHPEGQKLPTDPEKPCDICYCIRGAKKCTPKMCAPSIRSCLPVVKEGECCAASYDCSKTVPTVTAQQPTDAPRQFDFFSMLFGLDEQAENSTNAYPEDRTPPEMKQKNTDKNKKEEIDDDDDDEDDDDDDEIINQTIGDDDDDDDYNDSSLSSSQSPASSTSSQSTTEKSFFDVIREGLDIIDNNGDKIEKIIDKTTPNTTIKIKEKVKIENPSFLDLLLGPDDDEEYEAWKNRTSSSTESPMIIQRPAVPQHRPPTVYFPQLSYSDNVYEKLDFPPRPNVIRPLVQPPHLLNQNNRINYSVPVTENQPFIGYYETTTNLNSETPTNIPEIQDILSTTTLYSPTTTVVLVDNTESSESTTLIADWSTHTYSESTIPTTTALGNEITTEVINNIALEETTSPLTTTTTTEQPTTTTIMTTKKPKISTTKKIRITTTKPTTITTKPTTSTTTVLPTTTSTTITAITKLLTTKLPKTSTKSSTTIKQNNIELKKIVNPTTTTSTTTTTTIKPFSKIPIATTTLKPNTIKKSPVQTLQSITLKLDASMKMNQKTPSTQRPPLKLFDSIPKRPLNDTLLIISTNDDDDDNDKEKTKKRPNHTPKPDNLKPNHESNPTILETDYQYDYNEPTLPPSLPNLKIIPFLPTDAVKHDHKKVPYNSFYKIKTPSDGLPTEYELYNPEPTIYPNVEPNESNKRIDYDIFKTASSSYQNYPSLITADDKDYEFDTDHKVLHDKYSGVVKFVSSKYHTPGSVASGSAVLVEPEHDDKILDFDKMNYGVNYGYGEYPKIDYNTDNPLHMFRFSPPVRTEGGFRPRDPVKGNYYYDGAYHSKPMVNVTSAAEKLVQKINLTNLIIQNTLATTSTTNPFKDVIKTEPAPDLLSLIEDKEKLLAANRMTTNFTFYDDDDENENENDEKEIISITTDKNFNLTNRNVDDVSIDDDGDRLNNFSKFDLKINLTDLEQQKRPNLTKDDDNGFFGSVLSFLFNDEDPNPPTPRPNNLTEKITIPPFKILPKIPELFEIKDDEDESSTEIIQTTTSVVTLTTTTNAPTTISPSTTSEKILPVYSLNTKNEQVKTSIVKTSPKIDNINLLFPHHSIRTDLDLIIPELNNNKNYYSESNNYQVIKDDSTITNTESDVINPVSFDQIQDRHHERHEGSAEIFTKPANSLTQGILKLAGCNIYGRMYRVGKIISELSGPCLECKCTDIGVNCTPLNC